MSNNALPASRQSPKEPSKLMVIAAFAAIYIIWGSTYTAVRIAVREIPPLTLGGLRFGIAGLVLFGFARITGETIPATRSVLRNATAGALTLFIGVGAVAFAEQYISSGLTAIIIATVPIWLVVLDRKQWKSNFGNKGIIAGLIIGFIGIFTLFAGRQTLNFGGNAMKTWSILLLLAGAISWATGSLVSKYETVKGSATMKAAIQMIAAGICSLIAGCCRGEPDHFSFSAIHLPALIAFLYITFIGSLIGYMSYVWLLSVRSATLVGTYAYVNPVVAVFLGWLLTSETISWQHLFALLIILAGVIMTALSRARAENKRKGIN